MSTNPPTRAAFFYGTLMAPAVLSRVCRGPGTPGAVSQQPGGLGHARPAVLHGHRRHRVKDADYPAIVQRAGASVRGTFVTGLSDADVWRLDIFEGSEYRRENVVVALLGGPPGAEAETGETATAETYVWTADPAELEDREWGFDEFRREKMRFWVGKEGAGEYAEVDEAVSAQQQEEHQQQHDRTGGRSANGHISLALQQEQR